MRKARLNFAGAPKILAKIPDHKCPILLREDCRIATPEPQLDAYLMFVLKSVNADAIILVEREGQMPTVILK